MNERSRRRILQLISAAAALPLALSARQVARAAAVAPTVKLTYRGRAASGALAFQYAVNNSGAASLYLVGGNRMPYITVVAPNKIELHFDVIDTPAEPYMFPLVDVTPLAAGATRAQSLRIAYPIAPSDHFHLSAKGVPTKLPLSVQAFQGYSDKLFVSNKDSKIYREFLSWQQTASSPVIVIPHF